MSEQTVTQEIESWIAQYGSERDALNVAIAKLHAAPSILQEQELIELREQKSVLLSACESFVELFCNSDMRPEDEAHELFAVMRAAIAKAKGESESLVTSEGTSE